jgi:hypothetical protein
MCVRYIYYILYIGNAVAIKTSCFICLYCASELKKLGSDPTLTGVRPHTPHPPVMEIGVRPHTLSTALLPLLEGEDAVLLGNGAISPLADPPGEDLCS